MKILKVLGVVFAVHAAIFMFVFAIPGCRTTARSTPPPPPAEAPVTSNTVTYPGAVGSGPVSTATGDSSSSVSGAELNPGTSGDAPTVSFNAGPAVGQHFNPTRPGTAVASALQSGDVTGVTPATTYKVVSNDSLWKIAKKHGIGVDDLAKANNLRPSSPLKVGQKLIIPGKPTTNGAGKGQSGAAGSPWTYTVKSGDSLGSIARRNGTTTVVIRSMNPQLKSDLVRVGQDLTLPASASSASTAASAIAPSPVAVSGQVSAPVGSIEHIVKAGEGLSLIAKKYGVPMREIAALNNIANPTSLRAGQKIIIPGVKTPGPAAAPLVMPAVETTPVAPVESPVAPAPVAEPSPVAPQAAPDAMQPPVVKVDDTSTPVAPAQN